MIEILEQHFPLDVVRNIMLYYSHTTADLLDGLINEWQYYRQKSCKKLLAFNHYAHNKDFTSVRRRTGEERLFHI